MDFQKQFDTVTGALNIFDMSYLVSGATMLGVFVYAFPGLKDFVFHKDQVTVSIIICIVIAYVLGMISWIAGKQFRYWMMKHFGDKKTNDEDFESKFQETAQCFDFQGETIKKLMEDDKNIAYEYLSPYSFDLNPIEKLWSKMEVSLKKQKICVVDKLSDAV